MDVGNLVDFVTENQIYQVRHKRIVYFLYIIIIYSFIDSNC